MCLLNIGMKMWRSDEYINQFRYFCVKINTLNDKERPICLLAALQTIC